MHSLEIVVRAVCNATREDDFFSVFVTSARYFHDDRGGSRDMIAEVSRTNPDRRLKRTSRRAPKASREKRDGGRAASRDIRTIYRSRRNKGLYRKSECKCE